MKKYFIILFHRLGIHNKRCRRRLFTKDNTYICLITGNYHKNIIYEILNVFKKN